MKQCSKCKEIKSLDHFYKNKNYKDGLYYQCKTCVSIYMKEYGQTHPNYNPTRKKVYLTRYPERHNQQNREWAAKNLERSRLQKRTSEAKRRTQGQGTITTQQIRELIASSKNICFWCLQEVQDGQFHLDHVHPLSKGGKTSIDNLVYSCAACNRKKHDLTPVEWMGKLQRITQEQRMGV